LSGAHAEQAMFFEEDAKQMIADPERKSRYFVVMLEDYSIATMICWSVVRLSEQRMSAPRVLRRSTTPKNPAKVDPLAVLVRKAEQNLTTAH